jgi:hypothetical protein
VQKKTVPKKSQILKFRFLKILKSVSKYNIQFFFWLIQIANCLNCKGKRQKKELKKIVVKKILPNNRTGYTFCAGYTYCAHCIPTIFVGQFVSKHPSPPAVNNGFAGHFVSLFCSLSRLQR